MNADRCTDVRECKQGEEIQADPTVSSDRVCRPCVDGLTYQDEINGDSCKSVSTCSGGYSEVSPATVFQDRLCRAPSTSKFLESTTGIGSVVGAVCGTILILMLIVVVLVRRRSRRDGATLSAGVLPTKGDGAAFQNPMYDSLAGGTAASSYYDGGVDAEDDHGGYSNFDPNGSENDAEEPGYLDVSEVPAGGLDMDANSSYIDVDNGGEPDE